ncbi:4Fe-4S ferredoxin iron-sulfur binding domain-containing protein [Desulfofundulus kuznetsovii DSM 6115]|uniref:4Fe-4S ferredoxin iron-sulfur binding domain-containing protein n=2 Tax=Peptococcaceae TaxID=186807 RepID=A0AAU8PBZ2_DESK7|nr:4Fe-4S ferredoxin iron-sulfur binding domain-containing protein [Desulfofundulus kuznetsovii DSM 6115]
MVNISNPLINILQAKILCSIIGEKREADLPMPAYVVRDLCAGCGACAHVCPYKAITVAAKLATVDPGLCRECEECIFICPNGAITAA